MSFKLRATPPFLPPSVPFSSFPQSLVHHAPCRCHMSSEHMARQSRVTSPPHDGPPPAAVPAAARHTRSTPS